MSDKKKNKTAKQLNRKAKIIKYSSAATIGLTTLGGFFGYEMYIDWENFRQDLENFVVVQEETLKLNLGIAMPMLISLLVYLFVMRRKNKDFLKDKASIGLFIAILITYFFYSIAEALLFSLIGAFVGVVADEFGFSVWINRTKETANKMEIREDAYEEEKIRIQAREEARKKVQDDTYV